MLVATLSVRTGIAPQYIADLDPEMFRAMCDVIHRQDEDARKASKRKR